MPLKSISLINYVVLPCRDMGEAKRFYQDAMGFQIKFDHPQSIQFQNGATTLRR